ncbi:MAG: hypothetical protein IIA90_02445 [Chloroflexi bacterium]|nr:hypothetical protein [Chloroflexota bacterium]
MVWVIQEVFKAEFPRNHVQFVFVDCFNGDAHETRHSRLLPMSEFTQLFV